jgi:hypothetical protein
MIAVAAERHCCCCCVAGWCCHRSQQVGHLGTESVQGSLLSLQSIEGREVECTGRQQAGKQVELIG